MMLRVLFAILLVLLFTGCAAYQANVQQAQQTGGLAGILQFTLVDLQAADARAVAAGDTTAHQCYPVLIGVVQNAQNLAGKPNAGPAGPIDLFEATRVLAKTGPNSANAVATEINNGCAALFVDSQVTLAKLGILGAAVVPKVP